LVLDVDARTAIARVLGMASDDFDPDGLVQAKRLIRELEEHLEDQLGLDEQHRVHLLDERKMLRVVRILADQVEMLREE